MKELIDRAREYLTDKYLDVADVPLFIAEFVRLYDENVDLINEVGGLQNDVEQLEAHLNDLYADGPHDS